MAFKVGSVVRLKRLPVEGSHTGVYEVIRLVPPDVDGVPCLVSRERGGPYSEPEATPCIP